jgi:hypothetical protein
MLEKKNGGTNFTLRIRKQALCSMLRSSKGGGGGGKGRGK